LDFIDNLLHFADGETTVLHTENGHSTPRILCGSNIVLKPFSLAYLPIGFSHPFRGVMMAVADLGSELYIQDGILSHKSPHIFITNTSLSDMTVNKGDKLPVKLHTVRDFNLIDASKIFKLTNAGSPIINQDFPLRIPLLHLISDFQSKFRSQGWGTNHTAHRIRLNSKNPVYSNAYVYGPKESAFVDDKINEQLQKGVIRPSNSSFAAPVVPAPDPSYNGVVITVDGRRVVLAH